MQNTFGKIKQVISGIGSPKVFGIAAFLVIAAAIPLTIYVAQKQQEVRQRASEVSSTPPLCQAVPTDTMLVIDTSGSMGWDYVGGFPRTTNDKLVKAKQAAQLFVDNLSRDNRNRFGLVSFSNDFLAGSPLTQDPQAVKSKIQMLVANGGTCTRCGIKGGNDQITSGGRAGIKKVVILLTDGLANMIYRTDPIPALTPTANPTAPVPITPSVTRNPSVTPVVTLPITPTPSFTIAPTPGCKIINDIPVCPNGVLGETDSSGGEFANTPGTAAFGDTIQKDPRIAEQIALDVAKQGNTSSGTVFYTIGLGSDVNASFLTEIARSTGGEYFFAASSGELQGIYDQIFQIIGRGSVNGFVWNDANGNAIYDPNEQKLPGWNIYLNKAEGNTPMLQTTLTNASGEYGFTDICDGDFKIIQEHRTGYTQTFPTGTEEFVPHRISIINGSALTNKNFGNKIATPTEVTPTAPTITLTPVPTGDGVTKLELDLKLQSIGTDAANPRNVVLNSRPVHAERDVVVEVFNSVDNRVQAIVATASGRVFYDRTSGTFKGIVPVSGISTTGDYAIKVTVDKFLRKLIGRETQQPVFRIVVGQSNTIPQTTLIAGDLNGDNKLNIIDYVNYWLPCHNKSKDTRIPDTNKTCEATDLNDDGQVDHDNDENADNINMRDYRWLYNSFQVQEGD